MRAFSLILSALLGIGLVGAPAAAERGEARTLTVFAAASLTDAFRRIGRDFERASPGVTVRFNFGASNTLGVQINEGAPADVFASASGRPMDLVAHAGNALDTPVVLCRNRLCVVVPRDNPARIRAWTDVARPGVKLVLAAPGVPAGDFAREALGRAGILPAALRNLVSNEENVRMTLGKVALGEADAAIVYVTDARARPSVRAVEIPDAANVVATYQIAAVRASAHPDLARAFVAFATGPTGRRILGSYGFVVGP